MQHSAQVLSDIHSLLTICQLQGLAEMHQADFTPADVKIHNVVVDLTRLRGGQGPLVKLVDFGQACSGRHAALACQLHRLHETNMLNKFTIRKQ